MSILGFMNYNRKISEPQYVVIALLKYHKIGVFSEKL